MYVCGVLVRGKCVRANGTYEGIVEHDKIVKGTFIGMSGTRWINYEGEFVDWNAEGKGKLVTGERLFRVTQEGFFESWNLIDGTITDNNFIATGKFGIGYWPIWGTYKWLVGPYVGALYSGNIASGRGVKIDYGNGITAVGDIVDLNGNHRWTLNGQAKMTFGLPTGKTNEQLVEMSKNDAIPIYYTTYNDGQTSIPIRSLNLCLSWGKDRNLITHCCDVVFDGIYVDDVPQSGKITFCDENMRKWEYVGAVNANYLPHGTGCAHLLTYEDDEPIDDPIDEESFTGLFENDRLIEGKIRDGLNITVEGNFRENGLISATRLRYANFVGTVEGVGKFTNPDDGWHIVDTFSNYSPALKKYDVFFQVNRQIKFTIADTEFVMGKNSPIHFHGIAIGGMLGGGIFEDDCYTFNNDEGKLLRVDTEDWECRGVFRGNCSDGYILQNGTYHTPDFTMRGQFVNPPSSSENPPSVMNPSSVMNPAAMTVLYANGDVYIGPTNGSSGRYCFTNGFSYIGICPNRKPPPELAISASMVTTLPVGTTAVVLTPDGLMPIGTTPMSIPTPMPNTPVIANTNVDNDQE